MNDRATGSFVRMIKAMTFELFFAFVVAALLLSIVVQVQDFTGRRRQASVTHEPRQWPWARYFFLGSIPAAMPAGWSYDTVFGRRYRVADWLHLFRTTQVDVGRGL